MYIRTSIHPSPPGLKSAPLGSKSSPWTPSSKQSNALKHAPSPSGRLEIHPSVLQDIGPLGPLPCSHTTSSAITPSRASGTADHVQSLDDLFSIRGCVSRSACLPFKWDETGWSGISPKLMLVFGLKLRPSVGRPSVHPPRSS